MIILNFSLPFELLANEIYDSYSTFRPIFTSNERSAFSGIDFAYERVMILIGGSRGLSSKPHELYN